MTPRFLLEAVEVSMLSTKWMLWGDLALPRTSQQWAGDLPHVAMRVYSDDYDLNISARSVLNGTCLLNS